MCEPNHSIVQYPPEDPNTGSPAQPRLEASGLAKVWDWMRKIGGYLHFSKLGSGHHEAVRKLGTLSYLIPEETRYEANWWNRKVIADGRFNAGPEFDAQVALEAATDYAKIVSIGSLFAVRRFLETSMRKTEMPKYYLTQFIEGMLNKEGRNHVLLKLRSLNTKLIINPGGRYHDPFHTDGPGRGREINESVVESAIKVMLGATRRREWLVPEWADDSLLWSPGQ